MEEQALADAQRALAMANALKIAVVAIVMTHPDQARLKGMLSRLYSGMAVPGSPLDLSPSTKDGWYEVVRLLQDSLGGFPVMTEIADAQPPA